MDQYQTHIEHSKFDNGIYLVGNYETRVTVHSQQIRSYNLVYSLFKKNSLSKKSNVAIIGAGVSGLSIASILTLLGVKKVTLFEEGGSNMPLWVNCNSRWLHPNLFNWPSKDWNKERTDLPFLNWSSDFASNVATQINHQWNALTSHFPSKIEMHLNTRARINRGTRKVNWDGTNSKEFDVIFICVGYGRDGKRNDEETCYWANDNVAAFKRKKVKFFLSGNGDGGISDLLRIRLQDFGLKFLLQRLETPEINKIQSRLADLESKALEVFLSMGYQKSSEFLQNEYNRIKTPNLVKEIRKRFRDDTSVMFHSRDESLYNVRAFPLNRFLLSRYLQASDPNFEFVFGEIENLNDLIRSDKTPSRDGVILTDRGRLNSDVFISRHGPVGALSSDDFRWISDSKTVGEIKAKNKLDQTGAELIFDKEFFDSNKDYLAVHYSLRKDVIALAIVEHADTKKFLFTERRSKEQFLEWGFPAKRIKNPGDDRITALKLECEQETGVQILPKELIGTRVHNLSGRILEYWYCVYVGGDLTVKDKNELSKAEWKTPLEIELLSKDLYEPIKRFIYGKLK